MLVDMRYHVVSMVAVFLALGLGLLVGSATIGENVVLQQQERIIDRLELDFAELRSSREELRARLAVAERLLAASFEFEEDVCETLAANRIAGKRIAVVVTGDGVSREQLDAVSRAIEGAGGAVTCVARVLRRLEPVSTDEARAVAAACGVVPGSAAAVAREAARALARRVTTNEADERAQALQDLGYLALASLAPGAADAVVVAGGSRDPAHDVERLDVPVIRALREMGVPTVGVESVDVPFSCMAEYRREGISTVDCVDTPLGRLSLVYVLAGRRGHFGVKETAEASIPDALAS